MSSRASKNLAQAHKMSNLGVKNSGLDDLLEENNIYEGVID